jgi:hypothetical protein
LYICKIQSLGFIIFFDYSKCFNGTTVERHPLFWMAGPVIETGSFLQTQLSRCLPTLSSEDKNGYQNAVFCSKYQMTRYRDPEIPSVIGHDLK